MRCMWVHEMDNRSRTEGKVDGNKRSSNMLKRKTGIRHVGKCGRYTIRKL